MPEKYQMTRPCIANRRAGGPQPALFHGWSRVAEVVAPSLMRGGHSGGQLSSTFALVEYQDGTVGEIEVNKIVFLDSEESFAVYDWEALGKAAVAREKEMEARYGR